MRRLLGVLFLAAAGCSGFASPTPDQLQLLASPPSAPVLERYRIQMSLDSRWLAGEFDGVVLAKHGGEAPAVRLQLFGDLGPKILDLLARPDRLTGYFPQGREGIDCSMPREAAPHPLIFMGASLLEQFSDRPASRVVGVREEPEGWWMRLKPVIPGMGVDAFRDRSGRVTKRRLSWMYGVGWVEEWPTPDEVRISASGVAIRVRILERSPNVVLKPGALELTLPPDVRVVQGTRP